jgi:menaquinone-9 beta-reductase
MTHPPSQIRNSNFEIRNSTGWDVIVVGAGPAGCAAATLLARDGRRVFLLDKAAGPPPKICGEYLSPGCLRILDAIGALGAVQAAGARPLHGMVIHSAAGRSLEAPYPRAMAQGGLPLHGLAIRRDRLDPMLLDLAVKSGATFEPSLQINELVWESGRVSGVRGRQRGQWHTVPGRLIIGADGRNSVVARRLGAVKRHRWLDKVALVGYVTDAQRAEDAGEIFLGRDRYAILNPVGANLTNVGLVINRRDYPHPSDPTRFLLDAARTLWGLGDRLASARPVAPARCLGPLAHMATRLTAPGALLIGDAAGFLDPFTGEGIYAGLRSAELAAQFIRSAPAKGSGARPEFDEYGSAWLREFLPKWRLCTALQYAIRHPPLADWLISRLRQYPRLASLLMAAVGDLIPAHELRLLRLLPRLLGGLEDPG